MIFPSSRMDLLIKVTSDLMWSLFGHRGDDVMRAEAADDVSKYVVLTLYFAFLILSTIMMINILVALLTKTFDNASVSQCRHHSYQHPLLKIPHNIFAITWQSFFVMLLMCSLNFKKSEFSV